MTSHDMTPFADVYIWCISFYDSIIGHNCGHRSLCVVSSIVSTCGWHFTVIGHTCGNRSLCVEPSIVSTSACFQNLARSSSRRHNFHKSTTTTKQHQPWRYRRLTTPQNNNNTSVRSRESVLKVISPNNGEWRFAWDDLFDFTFWMARISLLPSLTLSLFPFKQVRHLGQAHSLARSSSAIENGHVCCVVVLVSSVGHGRFLDFDLLAATFCPWRSSITWNCYQDMSLNTSILWVIDQ